MYNPLDTLQDIILGCDLDCGKSTLSRYLKKYGMESKVARSKIVISDVNKKKRVEFAKLMLGKTDLELESIWFSDETIVKGCPNGEIVLYRCPVGAEWFIPSNASSGKSVMFWGVISKRAYGPVLTRLLLTSQHLMITSFLKLKLQKAWSPFNRITRVFIKPLPCSHFLRKPI